MTRKALGLAILPVVLSVWLVDMGLNANRMFAMNDITRWPFVLFPLLLGGGILAVMVAAVFQNVTKRLLITASDFTYIEGKKQFTARWSNLAYSPPRRKGVIRTLLLSDGVHFGQVFDIFTPEFDALCATLEKKKGYSSTQGQPRFKM